MIDPHDVPQQQWPRQHVVRWKFPLREKHHYLSIDEAKAAARWNHKDWYYCNFCGTWHIGKRREHLERPTEIDGALPA